MNIAGRILVVCTCISLGGAASPLLAAELPKLDGDKPPAKDIVLREDAKCTSCHEETDAPQILSIGKTKHGTRADSRTPRCVDCHGESQAHVENAEKTQVRPKPDRSFSGQLISVPAENRVEHYFGILGKKTDTPVSERNDACLACHRKDSNKIFWMGSTHQTRDVACTSCHQIHTAEDKVRDRRTQTEFCFNCHKDVRSQINRPSHHPVPEGKMACSDCHNVHGSAGPKLVKRDSVVETCYTCHMEKRGPFVHNHPPVNEDCSHCHNPHGTTAESMLKVRPPFLCHQCHTPHGGNTAQLANQSAAPATVGRSGINYTQGRGCVNCHTQVHGSNNPANSHPNPQFNLR